MKNTKPTLNLRRHSIRTLNGLRTLTEFELRIVGGADSGSTPQTHSSRFAPR